MTSTLTAGPSGPLAAGGQFSPVTVKTSAYTANPGEFVPCDTTAGAFTVTLPSQPQDGAAVSVKMVAQGGANAVTVATAGGDTVNVQGGGASRSLALLYQGVILQYRASLGVWYVLGSDPGTGGGGPGTVTSASVVTANGFAGTVATETTTPAVTLETTVTGVLKGNGTAISAAAAGTDYLAPQPWQFLPESYGCQGNGQFISDAAITASASTLTTAGVADASTAPALGTATTGGTIAAGTYQAVYTFVSALGETLASASASITTTGSTSTITMTAPGAVPGGAIGYHVYITAAGGSVYYRQTQAGLPYPFPNKFVLLAPPVTATPPPPASNTTVSAPFTPAMAGDSIRVIGAGTSGADLLTTIATYVNPGEVTLTASAGTTVARSGAVFGTDDTANFITCLNAAAAYAAANNSAAEVACRPVIYVLATAPTAGGAYMGNCVIPTPNPPNGGPKTKLIIRGTSRDAATLPVYQQMVPETSGACFMYIGPNGTNNATYGASHVFGTPILSTTYGGESGTQPGTTNIKIVFDSIRVMVPYGSGVGGLDLFSAAECGVYNCSAQALGIVPSGGSWPVMAATGPAANQWGWGLRMPAAGNNIVCYTQSFACEGFCYGYGPSECSLTEFVNVLYCVTGIEAYSGNGTAGVHGCQINYADVQYCTNGVGFTNGGTKLDILKLETENVSKLVYDPGNLGSGTIRLRNSTVYGSSFANSAAGMTIINTQAVPGPVASPQAPPTTGNPWVNYYYLNAWITVTLSGGTFTSLNLSNAAGTSVAQPNAAGAAAYGFMLGAGQSYTPAYSGTLTHTVTLMPT